MATHTLMTAPPRSRRAIARSHVSDSDTAILEFQSPTAAVIAMPAPMTARVTAYAITLLVLSCVAVLSLVKVDRVVTAASQVVSQSPNIVLQPLETAIVRSVKVHEGQVVHKGELVAELDPTIASGDNRATSAQAASLQAQVDRLRAEIEKKPYEGDGTIYGQMQALMYSQRQQEYSAQVQSLTQKIESNRAKVEQLQADRATFAQRLQLAQIVESKRKELEHLAVGSQLNTLQAVDTRIQMQASLDDTIKQLQGAQRDLAGSIADLNQYVHKWFSDTSDTLATEERALSDMVGQNTKNDLRHKLVELRAPADAIVLSVAHVSVGTVMQSGDEFIRMVPSDAALVVAGAVDGAEAGYLKPGDPVTIKFDTLPYMVYGTAKGVLQSVSADSFSTPSDQNSLPGQPQVQASAPANMPGISSVYYRVRIAITQMNMHHLPSGFRVVPGMPVTADIKVGMRSVMEYFFARVLPATSEGLREP